MAQRQSWNGGGTSYASQQQQPQQQHDEQQQQQQHGYGAYDSYANVWHSGASNNWQQGLGLPIAPAFSGYGIRPQSLPPGYGGDSMLQYPMPAYYNPIGMVPETGIAPNNSSSQGYQQAFPPAYNPYYGPPLQYSQWGMQQPVWNPELQTRPDATGRNNHHQKNGNFQEKRGWKRTRDNNNNTNGNNRQQRPWQNNRNFGGDHGTRSRCEACDRSFVNRSQMDAHLKTHVKCSAPSCSFEAIGTVVNEHISQVHCPKPKVNKVISKELAEEIRKWREARRDNYPTSDNMRKKLQRLQVQHEKGQLVDEDAVKRQESLKEIVSRQKELGCPVAEIPTYYFSQRYIEPKVPRVRDPKEDSHEEGEIPNAGNRWRGKKVCDFFQRGRCRKGRRCTFLHSKNNFRVPQAGSAEEQQPNLHPHHQQQQQETKFRPPSLLAKLLRPDIEKENSQLLQCFRFLVDNNFLQDENAPIKHFEWTEDEESPGNDKLADISKDITDVEDDEDVDESEESDCDEELETGEIA